MDIPNFKEITQKLGIIKDYSSLLIPVVIGLIAVVVFIFSHFMSGNLKKRIADESISKGGKRIKSLIGNPVPSKQWKEEEKYQAAFGDDADRISLLARQSSQRELLSYKIFPEPKDTSALIFEEFGRRFRDAIDELIVRVNARDCPTEAELKRNMHGTSSSPSSRRGVRSVSGRLSEVDATIVEVLCREKAESAFVYANPADLSGYEFWEEYKYAGMEKAVRDCWYWQLAYWIIEDVIDTIAVCNSGTENVYTSPVKRLLSVSFTGGEDRGRIRTAAGIGLPSYVRSIKDGLVRPHTGRITNNETDIVHFNVSVVVSTKAILLFEQQLCGAKQHSFRGFSGREPEKDFRHNQTTILEYNITAIDHTMDEHSLYRYGEDDVARLDLVCEYIFNRAGYDEIKPSQVKEQMVGG